ncbi:MoaD/ThiS family protein [Arthrobacter sp. UKPF54-2]|uniref:MoaD/ThiS family protein n=1 Tax=Arthrobacter sp. UKPF54-2 TaxID=2600159 RepID=UPI0011B1A70A|nr:MoaD/ThiS family protein [Arthrobacter sp. UKPF54-2]QDY91529.1 MoaD/ThiS family protein [Arthrobacter sp. UKPF54-2]
MNVRYFAAARAAAGLDEEKFDLADGAPLASLLEAILAVERPEPPAGTPPLARILARSSFLVNEVAVRNGAALLSADDVVDVLPPFAGG